MTKDLRHAGIHRGPDRGVYRARERDPGNDAESRESSGRPSSAAESARRPPGQWARPSGPRAGFAATTPENRRKTDRRPRDSDAMKVGTMKHGVLGSLLVAIALGLQGCVAPAALGLMLLGSAAG